MRMLERASGLRSATCAGLVGGGGSASHTSTTDSSDFCRATASLALGALVRRAGYADLLPGGAIAARRRWKRPAVLRIGPPLYSDSLSREILGNCSNALMLFLYLLMNPETRRHRQ